MTEAGVANIFIVREEAREIIGENSSGPDEIEMKQQKNKSLKITLDGEGR